MDKKYIDVETLTKKIAENKLMSREPAAKRILQIIEGFPAADVQEVRHGEWTGTVCTACGESTSDYYDCDYCPRCGARMDGVKE